MKIFEYLKKRHEVSIRVFGIPLFKQSIYCLCEKRTSFLGGIITKTKIIDYNYNSKEDIKIWKLTILKRIERNNFRTFYLFNKKIRKVSLLKSFKKRYFKYFDKKYDDIYIISSNIGEAYLLLTYLIDSIIKNNNSKNPLLVATQKYHTDLVKTICPDIPYVYIKNLKFPPQDDYFKIDNFKFFIYFSKKFFKQAIGIKNNESEKSHYFSDILKKCNLLETDIGMRKLIIPDESNSSMLNKISKIGLNLNKFVFIAPKAQTFDLCDEYFWSELINGFQKKGIDVFVNLTGNNIKLNGDYKTSDLTIAEAFALAKISKKIISLRSGFAEFLLQTNVPLDVIYSNFCLWGVPCISKFRLIQLPFVDKSKIREFNTLEISQKDCLEMILNS